MTDQDPCDLYARTILLARAAEAELEREVQQFLVHHAAFVINSGIYHFGNSTLWYRSIVPGWREEERDLRPDLSFCLTAKESGSLEKDVAALLKEFPTFERFPGPPAPDPFGMEPDQYARLMHAIELSSS